MFEKSNEIAKFWSKGKLTAVKLTRKRNEKKKSEYDPDYHVRFRVEVALFDKNTNKQQECLYGSLKMDEIPVFIEALQIFGRKAYQYKLAGQNKMPSTEIFATYGGYENNGQAISTKLWINTAGPEMKADFFITADEAPADKDPSTGAYVRRKGGQIIRKVSMALSAEALLAIASQCQSALNILDMWSAMGTLDENLDRVSPLREGYGRAQQGSQYNGRQPAMPGGNYNNGYAAQDAGYGYGQMPAQNYAAQDAGYAPQNYAAQQGGYSGSYQQW